jgi:tetratricopeptide (TPR) repeat protein
MRDIGVEHAELGTSFLLEPTLQHFNRGNDLLDHRRFREALQAFDDALDTLPENPAILNNRGVVLSHLERDDEAVDSYVRSLKKRPDNFATLLNLGLALLRLGRMSEAVDTLERVLAEDKDHFGALFSLSVALYAMQRETEAIALINRALDILPTDEDAKMLRAEIIQALLMHLTQSGFASWSGEKPKERKNPVKLAPGPSISEIIDEMRE